VYVRGGELCGGDEYEEWVWWAVFEVAKAVCPSGGFGRLGAAFFVAEKLRSQRRFEQLGVQQGVPARVHWLLHNVTNTYTKQMETPTPARVTTLLIKH
jgi:hypothetical protein